MIYFILYWTLVTLYSAVYFKSCIRTKMYYLYLFMHIFTACVCHHLFFLFQNLKVCISTQIVWGHFRWVSICMCVMTLKGCRCVFVCVFVCSLVLKVLLSLQSVSVVWQVVSGLLSPPPFHPFSSHPPHFLHLPLPSQSLLAALVSSLSLWGFSLSLVPSLPLITVEDEWTLKPNTSCVCEREGGTQLLPPYGR